MILPQAVLNGVIEGCTYVQLALSFVLIYRTTRFFHLAHAAAYTVGAYLFYGLVGAWKVPLLLAVPLAIAGAGALGCAMELAVYRPLRNRRASSLVLLLASLGLYVVLQNLVSLFFGDNTRTLREGTVREGMLILGARITGSQVANVCAALSFVVGVWWLLRYTRLGRTVRAVSTDPELAVVRGIPVESAILLVFSVGSALAGASAILMAYDVDLTPTMGFQPFLMGVVAAIIGGIDSIPGALFGGLFLGLALNLATLFLPTQWQDTIAFGVLILFLLFRPQGFLGTSLRRVTV